MNITETPDWERELELGQGGFGVVCLYRKKNSDERIAIKRLRYRESDHDGMSKVFERWKLEVEMMGRLDHPNVIKALAVPPELDSVPGDQVLGMEFCKGGDLRKFLMRPENCCGLLEVYIRDILSGVGSAIEYLHSIRIIHRDIKPENIVLQPTEVESRYLYKIIDLGYAKELDSSSLCMSHVGTQQYLAPELYISKAYTRTVDYWSFGSLVFECITGKRPFLPEVTNLEWHHEVSKKSPEDITAFYDESGHVKFSKTLPSRNYLCRPLRKYVEMWLKLMLRWDSETRGGGVKKINDVEERPKCFCVLNQILEMKILHVFYAKANLLLSFPVREDHTIKVVHEAIELNINVPASNQLLIHRKGTLYKPDQLAFEACQDSSTESPSVFLFSASPIPVQLVKENKLPATVESIVNEPKTVIPFANHKEAWKNVVYWIANESADYKLLVSSQRAAILALMYTATHIDKQKVKVHEELKKLKAFQEFFNTSLKFDLAQCDSDKSPNLSAGMSGLRILLQQQEGMLKAEIQENEVLNQQVSALDRRSSELTHKVKELPRKPATKDVMNKLDDWERDAKELYDRLKKSRGTHETLDHEPMVRIVGKCFADHKPRTTALHESIDQALERFHQLRQIVPQTEDRIHEIQNKRNRLVGMQQERQEAVWTMASGRSGQRNVQFGMRSVAGDMSPNQMNIWNNGGNTSFLQSLTSNLDSIRLVDDSKTNVKRMDEVLDSMLLEHDDNMQYFSTLTTPSEGKLHGKTSS